MSKKVKLRERIMNRSIGFNQRQLEFFEEYSDFKPDPFCRLAVDEEIKKIDPNYL